MLSLLWHAFCILWGLNIAIIFILINLRYIKIEDRECEFNKNFRLILHTKLANPHYKPELQAQTTLINFTVTKDGLEDQLLAEVVSIERPELETVKVSLHDAIVSRSQWVSVIYLFVNFLWDDNHHINHISI